jgi:hypothetical protein
MPLPMDALNNEHLKKPTSLGIKADKKELP